MKSVVIPARMAGVEEVEVVVAHHERATLRVGDVFLKIDADQTHTDVEVEATGGFRHRISGVRDRRYSHRAVDRVVCGVGRCGCRVRMLHDAPLPPWPGRSLDELASHLDGECERLITNDVLPTDLVTRNRWVGTSAVLPTERAISSQRPTDLPRIDDQLRLVISDLDHIGIVANRVGNRTEISVSRLGQAFWSVALAVVCPCIAVMGL